MLEEEFDNYYFGSSVMGGNIVLILRDNMFANVNNDSRKYGLPTDTEQLVGELNFRST